MKWITNITICIMVAVLSISFWNISAKPNKMLSINVDKNSIKVGDDFEIVVRFKNTSKKSYSYSLFLFYTNVYNGIYDVNHKPIIARHLRCALRGIFPFENNFFTLNPNEERVLKYKFFVKKGDIVYNGEVQNRFYLFDGSNYCWFIDGKKKLIIKVRYSIGEQERQWQKDYKLENMYKKPLESNEVTIKIE